MNKFEIKSIAYVDIEVISDYISKDSKSAAKKLINEFYKTFKLLC